MDTSLGTTTEHGIVHTSLAVPEGSLIASYLSQFHPIDVATWEPAHYKTIIDYATDTIPFATVVTRTIGNRLHELEETLICLQAQTDQDFELCLVGHNIDDGKIATLTEFIQSQPTSLRTRIKFIVARGEGRARPLNAGFAAARSSYIICLDDDDLVYDNWIEEFHTAALAHSGAIIHCKVHDQAWEIYTDDGTHVLSAVDTPGCLWCTDFDSVEQLASNHCPIMSLAFPRFVFHDLGVTFNEELTTTEDWDFLIRAAMVCGVHNVDVATSLYRLWRGTDHSRHQHSVDEWSENHISILRGWEKHPLLMPGDALTTLLHATAIERDASIYLDLDTARATLFDADGEVLEQDIEASETKWRFPGFATFPVPRNTITYHGIDSNESATALGIWFGHCRTVTFRNITITCIDTQGTEWQPTLLDTEHNGVEVDATTIAFLGSGPWLKVPCVLPNGQRAHTVRITFAFDRFVRDDILQGTRIVIKAKNRLKRLRHKQH